MACSSKPGVKPFLDYIETATGQKITQADWHDIRELTAQEYGIEGKLPKNLVKKSDVITLLLHLDVDFCNQEDYEDNGEAYDDAWSAVEGKPVTQGTVMALGYLRDNGIEDTLAQVRLDRTAKKKGDNTDVTVDDAESDSTPVPDCLEECEWLSEEDIDGIAHQAYEMWPKLNNARDDLGLTYAELDINDLKPATLTSYMVDSDEDGLRHVETMMDDLEAGAELPPLIVFPDGKGGWWLADGCHRAAALGEHGVTKVNVIIAEPWRPEMATTKSFNMTM